MGSLRKICRRPERLQTTRGIFKIGGIVDSKAAKEIQNLNSKQRELLLIEVMEKILVTLSYMEKSLRPVRPLATVIETEVFKINQDGSKERATDMKLQLGQNAEIKVTGIKDAAGNPAQVEGDKLDWSVKGDLALGDLEVSADGLSALFKRNGAVGIVTVQVSGDADLGPDTKTIVGEVEVECLGGEAVVFELEANAVPAV